MAGVTWCYLAGGARSFEATLTPVQAVDPTVIGDLSAPVRGLAAFLLVATLGGLMLWRYGSFVDRSLEASMARPLSSLVYGVAAHAVIVFGGVYLTNQLAQVQVQGQNAGAVGVLLGLLFVLLAASLGFIVVGTTVVSVAGEQRHWYGLLVGAGIAGVAGFLGSIVGGILWFVVVSMGIGGPARRWLHADEVADARDPNRE